MSCNLAKCSHILQYVNITPIYFLQITEKTCYFQSKFSLCSLSLHKKRMPSKRHSFLSIIYLQQIKALCRSRGTGTMAISGLKNFPKLERRDFASPYIDQGSNQIPGHMIQKTIAQKRNSIRFPSCLTLASYSVRTGSIGTLPAA